MRKFEITEEQIMYLAQFGYAKDHLIKMFPAAFDLEWEETSLSDIIADADCKIYIRKSQASTNGYPDITIPHPTFKIEDGKIWRRKT
jgi:hypothetical protein